MAGNNVLVWAFLRSGIRKASGGAARTAVESARRGKKRRCSARGPEGEDGLDGGARTYVGSGRQRPAGKGV